MSLWFPTRDKDGKMHHVLVPFEPLVLVAFVGVAVALLLPLLVAFRNLAIEAPGRMAMAIAGVLLLGFVMFARAKLTMIRSNRFLSVGPRHMSRTMQVLYMAGYALMALGAVLALLFVMLAQRLT